MFGQAYHALHVSALSEFFKAAAVLLVLGPPGAFGNIGEFPGFKLVNDPVNVLCIGFDRKRAGPAA